MLASWGVQERVRWASSSVLGRRWRRTPGVPDEQDCSLSEGIRIRFRAQKPPTISKHFYRKNINRVVNGQKCKMPLHYGGIGATRLEKLLWKSRCTQP